MRKRDLTNNEMKKIFGGDLSDVLKNRPLRPGSEINVGGSDSENYVNKDLLLQHESIDPNDPNFNEEVCVEWYLGNLGILNTDTNPANDVEINAYLDDHCSVKQPAAETPVEGAPVTGEHAPVVQPDGAQPAAIPVKEAAPAQTTTTTTTTTTTHAPKETK